VSPSEGTSAKPEGALTATQAKVVAALETLAAGRSELSTIEVRRSLYDLRLSRQTASKVRLALEERGVLTATASGMLEFKP